ncbi:uncharacterized protein BP01DRAFT_353947 [Aspergillus saccharolyticus JOP 1030-1]|uniref:CBM-cenC domain-containing protein n=1 Tax=Aspergillus saccharolyticus JOP 1030-1 TaxID=1450539 RepID=A0A318ZKP1_9EURO|nr:hypothetical protein BP01DRAFT_353947 [Aspergillus saccharolyticus JOP 1030-1]PYH48076.1 hypothetical protein BP01DRAFT_353947 [Aspergillus saccharolyticus JOP 1030-1]
MQMTLKAAVVGFFVTTVSAISGGVCTYSYPQAVQNPSFEDGTTDWTIANGAAGSVYDTFWDTSAPDGNYVLAINGDLASNGLSQTLTGLVVGDAYTFGLSWQLISVGTGTCVLGVYMDSAAPSNLVAFGALTSVSSAWTQITGQWTATSTTHQLLLDFTCSGERFADASEVNFDDITLTGPVQVTCSVPRVDSSSSTPTPTPSSIPATVASSSSVIAVSTPTSTPSSIPATIASSSSVIAVSTSHGSSAVPVHSSSAPVPSKSLSSNSVIPPSPISSLSSLSVPVIATPVATPSSQARVGPSSSAPQSSSIRVPVSSSAVSGAVIPHRTPTTTPIASSAEDLEVVTSTIYATVTATIHACSLEL